MASPVRVVGDSRIGGHPRAEDRYPASLQQGDEFGGFHPIEGRRSGRPGRVVADRRPRLASRGVTLVLDAVILDAVIVVVVFVEGAISYTSTCFSEGSVSNSGTETVKMLCRRWR